MYLDAYLSNMYEGTRRKAARQSALYLTYKHKGLVSILEESSKYIHNTYNIHIYVLHTELLQHFHGHVRLLPL